MYHSLDKVCPQKLFYVKIKVIFHLPALASQFLNGTHEFAELVLIRMALIMVQSRSVLPLRSAKAREFGELWREKCTRAPWTYPFQILVRTSSFGRPWKATYALVNSSSKHKFYLHRICTF